MSDLDYRQNYSFSTNAEKYHSIVLIAGNSARTGITNYGEYAIFSLNTISVKNVTFMLQV